MVMLSDVMLNVFKPSVVVPFQWPRQAETDKTQRKKKRVNEPLTKKRFLVS
jgi:hypothetical protein